jgi:hypothetical protein
MNIVVLALSYKQKSHELWAADICCSNPNVLAMAVTPREVQASLDNRRWNGKLNVQ